MVEQKYDVIIIGGGIAGLSCATVLQSEGVSFLVLEKEDNLGGRIRTYFDDNVTIETGASFMAGFYRTVRQLVKQCEMSPESKKDSQDTWLYRPGKPLGPVWPLSALRKSRSISRRAKLRALWGALLMFIDTKRIRNFMLSQDLIKFDFESVKVWGERSFGREIYMNVLEPLMRALFFWDCSKTSRGMVPPIVKGVMEDRHFYRLPAGMTSFAKRLGSQFPHQLDSTVYTVKKAASQYMIHSSTGVYQARSVVFACPATETVRIFRQSGISPSEHLCSISYSSINVGIVNTNSTEDLGVGFRSIVVSSEYRTPLVAFKVIRSKKSNYFRFYWSSQNNDIQEEVVLEHVYSELMKMNLPRIAAAIQQGRLVDWVRWDSAIPLFNIGSISQVSSNALHEELPTGIYIAGDYTCAPHLEGAAESGIKAARRILKTIQK